jgi:hypothetical protein
MNGRIMVLRRVDGKKSSSLGKPPPGQAGGGFFNPPERKSSLPQKAQGIQKKNHPGFACLSGVNDSSGCRHIATFHQVLYSLIFPDKFRAASFKDDASDHESSDRNPPARLLACRLQRFQYAAGGCIFPG